MPSLGDIVAQLGGVLRGDPGVIIERVATLGHATAGTVSFLANPRYIAQLAATRASAVVLAPDHVADCPVAAIETPQPYLYFARLSALLNPPPLPRAGIATGATTESLIPSSCSLGPGAYVGSGVRLGEGVSIGAGCRILDGAEIGADSRLYPGVTIYPGCIIGRRAILHAGVVIGADGFGFAREADGAWLKIPQVGRVVLGDDVEIGANTTIDRGAIEDTVIGDGVKLDNQIQVAHNVVIGDHSAIAGCVGIAGSAVIGRHCTIGGGAIILAAPRYAPTEQGRGVVDRAGEVAGQHRDVIE